MAPAETTVSVPVMKDIMEMTVRKLPLVTAFLIPILQLVVNMEHVLKMKLVSATLDTIPQIKILHVKGC